MRFPIPVPHVMLAVSTACALLLSGVPGQARSSFDGRWTIHAAANPGVCSDNYGMVIRVSNGRVIYRGLLAAVASGTVGSDGRIVMQIGEARVTGRLDTATGGGHWASPRCRGAWTASRV